MNYYNTIACHRKLYSINDIHLIILFPQNSNMNSSGSIKNAAASAAVLVKKTIPDNFVNHMIISIHFSLPYLPPTSGSIHFPEIS